MSLSRQQRRAIERTQAKATRQQQAPSPTPAMATSTGPRTPEGKAIASQNSLVHGLTSSRLVLPWENQGEFNTLVDQLMLEHQPKTITESIYVREMAEQWWRLQRARNQEFALLCHTADRNSNPSLEEHGSPEKQLELVTRYMTRHERAFHRCFNLLRTLQKERRAREAEEAAELAATEDTSTTAPHQFVSQKDKTPEFVSQNVVSPAVSEPASASSQPLLLAKTA